MNTIKIFLILSLIALCSSCNSGDIDNKKQKGYRISQEEEKPLIALCQLWGFLKYHHPSVAEGNYDWDKELMLKISEIEQVEKEVEWKEILDNWIDSLPQIEANITKSLPDRRITLKPNYGQLFNPDYFLKETISKIDYILKNAVISNSHYIHINQGSGLMTIKNESDYKEVLKPNLQYRLLALFKHWNLVNYFFPYREMCDQDWNDVLVEMLPDFVKNENPDDYFMNCLKLHAKIDDSHGFFANFSDKYQKYIGMYQAPLDVRFIENELVVIGVLGNDNVVEKAVMVGDVIIAIDGKPIQEIVSKMLPYTEGSNLAVKHRNIVRHILRGNEKHVELMLLRNDERSTVEIIRYRPLRIAIPNHFHLQGKNEGYSIIENNIGYIVPSSCKKEDRRKGIKKVLNQTEGVIIDFRCYPSDYFSLELRKHLPCKTEGFSSNSYANIAYPGYFFVNNEGDTPCTKINRNAYTKPIVVIVNEYAQSSAEDNILVIQSTENVTVIGNTTAGANGKVTRFNLPCGITTTMTGVGCYYPDRSNLQRSGVKIDEYIDSSIQGIINGYDEPLERAIEIIKEKNKKPNA
jgi:C-terminal processing protease CtpA/Prc